MIDAWVDSNRSEESDGGTGVCLKASASGGDLVGKLTSFVVSVTKYQS